jgi:outer membrane protein
MKNKCILFIAIFFSVVSYVKAAPDDKKVLKIGFVKLDYIMNLLPETKQVEVDLKTFEKQLMQQLTEKLTGLQNRALNLQKETKKELNNQQKAQQEAADATITVGVRTIANRI